MIIVDKNEKLFSIYRDRKRIVKMTTIKIERIPKESIDTFDKTKWNSNNHPIKPEDIPEGMSELAYYKDENKKTILSEWLSLTNCDHIVTLSKESINSLMEAIPTGILSRRRPKNFVEELQDVEKEISKDWIEGDWFIRSDRVSPKDGVVALPISSAKKLVDALSTSDRFYKALKDGDNKLYFFKYDPTWDEDREVRVFVHKGKVTAISQYVWYRKTWFNERTDEELNIIVENIIKYAEKATKVLKDTDNATVDLYIENLEKIRLVEFNSFGYSQAAGACLFHWLNHYDILYGKTNNVVFRIVS